MLRWMQTRYGGHNVPSGMQWEARLSDQFVASLIQKSGTVWSLTTVGKDDSRSTVNISGDLESAQIQTTISLRNLGWLV